MQHCIVLSLQQEVGNKSCGCNERAALIYYSIGGRSHVVRIACHATTVEVQIDVIANDGHTFLEHRSCPRWHALMMCIRFVFISSDYLTPGCQDVQLYPFIGCTVHVLYL